MNNEKSKDLRTTEEGKKPFAQKHCHKIQVGDYVARISHHRDVMFKVAQISSQEAILKGVNLRLYADAPPEDLVLLSRSEINAFQEKYLTKHREVMRGIEHSRASVISGFLSRAKINYKKPPQSSQDVFELPGSVMHIDGDPQYLELCMNLYQQLNLKACGFCIPEEEQSQHIKELLLEHAPDIVVLTGHDGLLKGKRNFSDLGNYRNSQHFIKAVRKARELIPGKDDLIIFAGACQSHYESLIRAGANFASSPRRVLIHAYDPVFIAEKAAYTPFYQLIPIRDTVNNTITGAEGVGGIETHGRLRLGYPKSPY